MTFCDRADNCGTPPLVSHEHALHSIPPQPSNSCHQHSQQPPQPCMQPLLWSQLCMRHTTIPLQTHTPPAWRSHQTRQLDALCKLDAFLLAAEEAGNQSKYACRCLESKVKQREGWCGCELRTGPRAVIKRWIRALHKRGINQENQCWLSHQLRGTPTPTSKHS